MWLCTKWHGARLYGVHRTRRDSSSFMRNQPCQRCKYTTSVDSQKTRYTKLFTLVESQASAVSLLERGWCGFKCRQMSGWHLRNNAARERRTVLQKKKKKKRSTTSVTCCHTPAIHRCQQCQHQSRTIKRLQHTASNATSVIYIYKPEWCLTLLRCFITVLLSSCRVYISTIFSETMPKC